jgi:hypothetical protein
MSTMGDNIPPTFKSISNKKTTPPKPKPKSIVDLKKVIKLYIGK